jgi:hypothetical protein
MIAVTEIRPVELPEVRADIAAWLDGPTAAELWHKAVAAGHYHWLGFTGQRQHTMDGSVLRGTEILRLRQSELFYVAAEMVDLACAAARSIPDFQLHPEDLPAEAGLLVFEHPVASVPIVDEQLGITGLCWAPIPAQEDVLLVSTYIDRAESRPLLARVAPNRRLSEEPKLIYGHGGEFTWRFGDNEGHAPQSTHWVAALAPVLKAAWILMQQSLAAATDLEPPRAARRRLKRTGHEPSSVRLVELRRPHSASSESESIISREYHHQWIVRGHWRQQWYPTRQVHRPVWIAPHVKGPNDAPLIGGEKVNVWKR